MRNLSKLFVILLLVSLTATTNAQTLKFGHLDFQALLQVMPEMKTAETEYQKFVNDLQEVYDETQAEANQKFTEYQKLMQDATATDVKKQAKMDEVQQINQRLESFSQNAQQQMQDKQAELYQPIVEKAKNLVGDVAKENGLIYVFDSNNVLYFSNQSVDLLPLVKQKLGLE